jgi:hypothetical protein
MVYKDMTMYGITELYTEWFRVCTNITSTFRTIAMFRDSVQENNYVNNHHSEHGQGLGLKTRSSNVRHFRTVEAIGLKLWHRGYIQWHDVPVEFNKDLQRGSKVDTGDKHRQEGDLISLHSV